MRSKNHFISFTFDDFPKTSYLNGGKILERFGLTGTYYVSFSLIGKQSPSGEICDYEIIRDLLLKGHEIGCHTYSHLDAWQTEPYIYEASIINNRDLLHKLLPEVKFKTFAYPLGKATLKIKNIAGKYFNCCRGGSQNINSGKIDLNYLKAYFLDSRIGGNISNIKEIIDRNKYENGWLIFTTHDIDDNPSRCGNTPQFFEEVVKYSLNSRAMISTVNNIYENITSQE